MTARYDWTINQGEVARLDLTRADSENSAIPFVKSSDGTFSNAFKMQAKTKYGGDLVLELSSANSGEFTVADGTPNKVSIMISDVKSALIDAPGKYVFDVETINPSGSGAATGDRQRILEGTLIVKPEVTT